MGKGLEQTFLHRRHTNGQKYLKRRSTSLIISEMQIKTIMRHNFIPVMMASVQNKKQKRTSVGKDMEKLQHLCTVGGLVKCCSFCGKLHGDSSKN